MTCRVCGGPARWAWADGHYCGAEGCWDQRTWGLGLRHPQEGDTGSCGGRCHGDPGACYDPACPTYRPWVKVTPPPDATSPLAVRAEAHAATLRRERAVTAPHPDVVTITEPRVQNAIDARPTSVAAARAVMPRTGTQRRRILDAILDAHTRGHTGATDPELERHLSIPANSERPRRLELVQAGWVEDSGRVRVHGGRDHVVWAPTAAALQR